MSDLGPPAPPALDALMGALLGALLAAALWPLHHTPQALELAAPLVCAGAFGGVMLAYGLSRATPASERVFALPLLWIMGVWASFLAGPTGQELPGLQVPLISVAALGLVAALVLARRQRPERPRWGVALASYIPLGAVPVVLLQQHLNIHPALPLLATAMAGLLAIDRRTRQLELHALARVSLVAILVILPLTLR